MIKMNTIQYFRNNCIAGGIIAAIFTILMPVSTISMFLIFLGIFIATATLDFFFVSRRDTIGSFTTVKDWFIRQSIFGLIMGTGLFLLGGLETCLQIVLQFSVFAFFCLFTYPYISTKWNNWIKTLEAKNKQRRNDMENNA